MKPFSVLFLIRSLAVGGAERQLSQLARGLAARGHKVAIAVFYGGGAFESGLEQDNVVLVDLEKRGRGDLAGFARRFRRAVKDLDPDIVHSYLADSNLVAATLKPLLGRARLVCGVRASRFDTSGYDFATRLAMGLERFALRNADLVIANSSAGKASLAANGAFAGRIRVIHNGIDTGRFFPDEEAREKTRTRYGVEAGVPLVGMVARFDPLKDHGTFLRAAKRVLQQRPATRFVLVGDGTREERRGLEGFSRHLGLEDALLWDPGGEATAVLYNALDVLVSSSISEGFSNVIAEAMACDVPCAATDVGDSAEIVGETGRVVAPRDPEDLSAAILALLDGGTRSSPRLRIIERFGLEAQVTATESELVQLAAR